MSKPMWPVMFDPIEPARPDRSQGLYVIGEQRQADWEHPQSRDWKKPKNAARRQQEPCWDPEPATRRLADEANGRTNTFRQPIHESLEAPVIGAHGARLDLIGQGIHPA